MRPVFSIVTPVYNPPIDILEDTIASVAGQTLGLWELILVDDASPDPAVRTALRRAAGRDQRIRVIERQSNGHIVRASNDGIDAACGEFIVLLDHDDQLAPDALKRVFRTLRDHPTADYLYSDEDKLGQAGQYYDEFRKPDWSPERLRGQNYTSHLSVLRTSVVRQVGGFHQGFDGSQDHDLVLRVTEKAREVVHIPEVLYHWRAVAGSAAEELDAKPYAWTAGLKAVREHLVRIGAPAQVDYGPVMGTYAVNYQGDPAATVSVVIPTRGGTGTARGSRRVFVVECVRSLLAHAGPVPVEVVVVYDPATPPAVLDELREIADGALVLAPYTAPFNFAAKCNLGFLHSSGDVVVMLNDDIEITTEDFLSKLVGPLHDPEVGMTGARLLFEDGSIQHAGVVVSEPRIFYHVFRELASDEPGPFSALFVNRECSALTGACIAMRREVYEEAGGMREALPVNFNDVDLSLKVRYLGYRLVWLSNVTACHFESRSRTPTVHTWEIDLALERWSLPEDDLYLPELPRPSRRHGPI